MRGVLVLVAFPADGSYRRVVEVARELGMGRSTAYRYVSALAEARLLEQDPETRRYRRVR
jgi:DNA-binding IclR family transcriptional regulator